MRIGNRALIGPGRPSFGAPAYKPAKTTFNFVPGVLPGGAALTRASTGWYFNAAGNLVSAANDVARFPCDSAGNVRGLWDEPASTNVVRNSSCLGAVNPGTAPTNWTIPNPGSGLSRTIVGIGTEQGIPYVDVRYNGNRTSSFNIQIDPETTAGIATTPADTWTQATHCKVTAGTLAGLSFFGQRTLLSDSGSVNIPNAPQGATQAPQVGGNLRDASWVDTYSLAAFPTVAFVRPQLRVNVAQGIDVDFTMRIGLPRFEKQPMVTSPIVTTNATITRAADLLTLTVANGTYDVDIYRETGTTHVAAAVIAAGSYAVPPGYGPLKSVVFR